jgi:hypothetical protein
MAGLTYTKVDIRGVAAEPIIEELLFENDTIAKSLVTIEENVKAETIFTESTAEAVLQAYTCGVPTPSGSLDLFDTLVTPKKGQFYMEFCPDTLRSSRFKLDMKPGAWNMMSSEFERVVIGGIYAKKASLALENWFWNGITATTKAAIAALTAGIAANQVSANEKLLAAALTIPTTPVLCDGIIAKMIYNSSNASQTAGVGGRVKVNGIAGGINASNIKAEYDKIYSSIPAVVFSSTESPTIYAPKSHKQFLIQANNNTADFKKPFDIDVKGENFYFNGLMIAFVPLPENVVICAKKEYIVWATDLASDISLVEINKIANNREDCFIKINSTIETHVGNQKNNVLYVAV